MQLPVTHKQAGLLRAIIPIVLLAGAMLYMFDVIAQTSGELSDAPDMLPGQTTTSPGALQLIHGGLADTLDVDIYCIRIVDRSVFTATVLDSVMFDVQLFLFDSTGVGVVHNDDKPPGGRFESRITGALVPRVGVYYLAVSDYDRDPLDPGGHLIWLSEPVYDERAPDGPGAPGPLAAWTDTVEAVIGDYWLELEGCEACDTSGRQPGGWVELGDAFDQLPGQTTAGTGDLLGIFGELADTNDVDVYCIDITDAGGFTATTSAVPVFDTQLFLFDENGDGVTFNDDDPAGGTGNSSIGAANLPGPGTYYLAVSYHDNDPLTGGAIPIWLDAPPSAERAPDGAGAPGPLAAWSGGGDGQGLYAIALTGASFCTDEPVGIPPPAAGNDVGLEVHPNPFNPSTMVVYTLPQPGPVRILIYDVAGRLVRILVDGLRDAGRRSVQWNGRDNRGTPVASGVYFVRLEFDGRVTAQRAVLIK